MWKTREPAGKNYRYVVYDKLERWEKIAAAVGNFGNGSVSVTKRSGFLGTEILSVSICEICGNRKFRPKRVQSNESFPQISQILDAGIRRKTVQ